ATSGRGRVDAGPKACRKKSPSVVSFAIVARRVASRYESVSGDGRSGPVITAASGPFASASPASASEAAIVAASRAAARFGVRMEHIVDLSAAAHVGREG